MEPHSSGFIDIKIGCVRLILYIKRLYYNNKHGVLIFVWSVHTVESRATNNNSIPFSILRMSVPINL